MKTLQPVFALIVLIALILACGEGPTATSVPPTADKSVGTINLVFAQVQAGPPDHLVSLDGVQNFHNGDGVRVTGGGKGILDLNDGTRLILFNETELSGVDVSVSPRRSDFYLKQEGLMGSVPSGGRTTVKLPNGAKITILGTLFFILYDEQTEVAIAGNFDGTVLFSTPAGQERELQPGSMVEISAQSRVTVAEITFTPDDFEQAADSIGTPVRGLASLVEEAPPEPVTEEPVQPVAAPILLWPTDFVDVGCPSRTGDQIILEWQRPSDPGSIPGYELVLEVSDNNEFYGSALTFQIGGGDSIAYDISNIVDNTFTCTDYGRHYYRWKLQARDAAGNPGPWSKWATFSVSNLRVELVAPMQLAPPAGSVFDHYPRTTALEWSPVQGAASYAVEIDCYHCCETDAWCTDVGQTWQVIRDITRTTYTFDYVGAQPGRWRVWAVDASGKEGPSTEWWDFVYTR